MRESELLQHIYLRSADLAGTGGIVLGPGDDTAVVLLDGRTLVTVDQLVADRHYDAQSTTVDQIARKAMARSVSDIAAMGGVPTCALAAACLPDGFDAGDELFDRMAHWARELGCPLVGGDIAIRQGPMVLSVTILGRAHQKRGPVMRSQARVGDEIWVTGALGGSLESGRHLTFDPRLHEAHWLCDMLGDDLGAMIDLSDGLGRDCDRVASASNVRIELEARAIPMHEDVTDWMQATGEGEDYELLFTIRPGATLPDRCLHTQTPLHRIGAIVDGDGCVMRLDDDSVVDVSELGWDHGS